MYNPWVHVFKTIREEEESQLTTFTFWVISAEQWIVQLVIVIAADPPPQLCFLPHDG